MYEITKDEVSDTCNELWRCECTADELWYIKEYDPSCPMCGASHEDSADLDWNDAINYLNDLGIAFKISRVTIN